MTPVLAELSAGTCAVRLRELVCLLVLLSPGALLAQSNLEDRAIVELPLVDLQARLTEGSLTAERVTRAFLERIATLDDAGPTLGAIIEINPDAIAIARELDRRFARGEPSGPLHGVPVVIKASIDTADRMATSAGSIALASHRASMDAALVARLRAAGAVLLAKTNLSEWANFRSRASTSGWSSLGGQTRSPYVLDRNPCGSSSGSAVAVAARLAPLAIGTETDGSIVCPAGVNGVVGIKPTIGLVSRRGIVPIAASQDTAGPIARTARDAAVLLAVIADATGREYSFDRSDLRGVRLGVVRDYRGAGENAAVEAAYEHALALLGRAGAELVDPILVRLGADVDAAELELLLYEFKTGIDEYLATMKTGPRSLAALIDFNDAHAAEVMPHFGQELFLEARTRGGLDDATYRRAVLESTERLRVTLARLFEEQELDALVAPTNGPAWRIDWRNGDRYAVGSSNLAAISGYPSIAVPAVLADELPIGITLVAEPFEEQLLVDIALVFERLRGEFPAPQFLPTID